METYEMLVTAEIYVKVKANNTTEAMMQCYDLFEHDDNVKIISEPEVIDIQTCDDDYYLEDTFYSTEVINDDWE